MNQFGRKSKIALAVTVMYGAMGVVQAAENSIYIDTNDASVKTLSIQQGSPANGANAIGTTLSNFSVKGNWSEIAITQTQSTSLSDAGGNAVTGTVRADATASTTEKLKVTQTGADNKVVLTVGSVSSQPANPMLDISQVGDDNSATYSLTNTGTTTILDSITGNSNTVQVTATGTGIDSATVIKGNSNTVKSNRTVGSYTDRFNVYGNSNLVDLATVTNTAAGSNIATVNIGSSAPGGSYDNNKVYVEQTGSGNDAEITATGNGNTLTVRQSGTTTVADVAVTGNTNGITLVQSANSTTANINVIVNSATINVTQQTNGANYSLIGVLTDSAVVNVTQ